MIGERRIALRSPRAQERSAAFADAAQSFAVELDLVRRGGSLGPNIFRGSESERSGRISALAHGHGATPTQAVVIHLVNLVLRKQSKQHHRRGAGQTGDARQILLIDVIIGHGKDAGPGIPVRCFTMNDDTNVSWANGFPRDMESFVCARAARRNRRPYMRAITSRHDC